MTREREDFFEQYRANRGGGAGGGGGGGRGGFSRQAQVKALKESVQTGHRTGLPSKLLELFEARQRPDRGSDLARKRPKPPMTGLSPYVEKFAQPGDAEYEMDTNTPPEPRLCRNRELPQQARIESETKMEKKIRVIQWQKDEAKNQIAEAAKAWDPSKDANIDGDPFKTLFVSRLSYDVTEKKLRREFDEFGPIKNLRIVYHKDKASGEGKPCYAFIEYEHKKDMKEAYKHADGRKIESRRIVVDVERGRTVENWRPRRLGGGLGGQGREAKAPKKGGSSLLMPPRPDEGLADDGRRGPPRDDRGPPRDDPRGSSYRPRDDPRSRDRARSPPRDARREERKRSRSPRREDRGSDKRRHGEEDDRRERRREKDAL